MAPFKSLAAKARQKLKKLSRRTDSDDQESPPKPHSHAIRMLVDHEIHQLQDASVADRARMSTSGEALQHAESKMFPLLTTSGFPKPDFTNEGPHPADTANPQTSSEWSWSPSPKSSQILTSDDRESLNPFLETASFFEVGDTIDPKRPSREYGRARFDYEFNFFDSTHECNLYKKYDYIQAFLKRPQWPGSENATTTSQLAKSITPRRNTKDNDYEGPEGAYTTRDGISAWRKPLDLDEQGSGSARLESFSLASIVSILRLPWPKT